MNVYLIFVHFTQNILIISILPPSSIHPMASPPDSMHSVIYIKAYQVKLVYSDIPQCKFIHLGLTSLSPRQPIHLMPISIKCSGGLLWQSFKGQYYKLQQNFGLFFFIKSLVEKQICSGKACLGLSE